MNSIALTDPPSASTFAPQVDGLYLFLVLLSGVIVVGTFAAAIYFSIRYRRRPGVRAAHIDGVARVGLGWVFSEDRDVGRGHFGDQYGRWRGRAGTLVLGDGLASDHGKCDAAGHEDGRGGIFVR